MFKSRFPETQILGISKAVEAGRLVKTPVVSIALLKRPNTNGSLSMEVRKQAT